MTGLPSQHPNLSLHLTDLTLTPLISSSSSQSHLESLTSLATTALTSQTAVQRVNLGAPQRIMVEYPDRGPVVLQSYLDPATVATITPRPSSTTSRPLLSRPPTVNPTSTNETGDDPAKSDDAPPMLLSVVVAGSADQTREARRAAARLEKVGRDFQKEWASDSSNRLDEETSS